MKSDFSYIKNIHSYMKRAKKRYQTNSLLLQNIILTGITKTIDLTSPLLL
mgnify:CR=1 FL=1